MGHDRHPMPPGRYVQNGDGSYRRKNTELHDALFSLGFDDRTGEVSTGELYSQAFREAGYFFKKGNSYFADAVDSFLSIFA